MAGGGGGCEESAPNNGRTRGSSNGLGPLTRSGTSQKAGTSPFFCCGTTFAFKITPIRALARFRGHYMLSQAITGRLIEWPLFRVILIKNREEIGLFSFA